jgi:hypothetical protein
MKFQFSIRDLLLIVVIAALAAGWWIDHQRINRLVVQKWEYKFEGVFDGAPADIAKINNLGDQGWEIQSVLTKERGDYALMFKRAKN